MADITLTRGQIQDWVSESVEAAFAPFKEARKAEALAGKVAAKQDDPHPSFIDLYGVTIDGKPVKAELINGQYQVSKASMKTPGIAGLLETADDVKLPFLNLKLGPIGSAVGGVFVGSVVHNLVDKVVSPIKDDGKKNYLNLGAQALAAGALATWGPKYVGKTAAYFASGALIVGLAMRWTPFQDWVVKATDMLSGPLQSVRVGQGGMKQRMLSPGHVVDASPAFAQRSVGSMSQAFN